MGFIRLYLFFYSHSVSFWLFIRSHCDVRVVVASVFWSLLVNVCQCVLGFSIHQKKKHSRTHTPPKLLCAHTHTWSLINVALPICVTHKHTLYITHSFFCVRSLVGWMTVRILKILLLLLFYFISAACCISSCQYHLYCVRKK